LDPELSALGWDIDTVVLAQRRRESFLAWARYDRLHRLIGNVLSADPEWRQGPAKSWDIARGPVDAVGQMTGERRLAVDTGAGSHFPESTGWLLWLESGFSEVICLEPSEGALGSESGALLDLVHWLLDQMATEGTARRGLASSSDRLAMLHRRALLGVPIDGVADPVRVRRCILEELCLDAGSVDLITSNAVFEHVRDPAMVLRECRRVLREGGLLHSVIDFRDHRSYTHPAQFVPLPSRARDGSWADPDTNGWGWHEWNSEIQRIGGLEMISLKLLGVGDDLLAEDAANDYVASAEIVLRRL
jgi:SAM-dependent methyltransferase